MKTKLDCTVDERDLRPGGLGGEARLSPLNHLQPHQMANASLDDAHVVSLSGAFLRNGSSSCTLDWKARQSYLIEI